MKIVPLQVQAVKMEKQAQQSQLAPQTPQTFKIHNPEDMISYVDAIILHRARQESELDKATLAKIGRLPSRKYILGHLSPTELIILFENVQDIWKTITGENIPNEEPERSPRSAQDVDGAFWLLPGGVTISGFNHFSAAKRHKNLLCNLLDINPFIFEKKMHLNPSELIRMIIHHGGVRMHIDRENSRVIAQTNENSWPTTMLKLQKMYHKHKIARILDLSRPYKGWKSGIPILVN